MRRNDGKPKRRAKRSKAEFEFAFRDDPATEEYRHPTWNGTRTVDNYAVVSLFAGCGGLDLGLVGGFEWLGKRHEQNPFDVIYAADYLDDAVETYKLNLGPHIELADLTEIDLSELPTADLLAGGFPCQDFSSSGPKTGLSGKRGQLYKVMVEYMEHHRPKVVLGENVPHLARLSGGAYLDAILSELEAVGYRFEVWELYGPEYGLPQSRRRLFLVGVRDDLPGFPEPPTPTHPDSIVTISEAIDDLIPVTDESVPNQSQFFIATRAQSGGGQGDHTNRADDVAYCIRANARGRIQFHHSLDRRLTVRECARLQAFPDEFVFPYATQRNLTLIGNAVPPILGHVVGAQIAAYLAADADELKRLADLEDHRRLEGEDPQLELFGVA